MFTFHCRNLTAWDETRSHCVEHFYYHLKSPVKAFNGGFFRHVPHGSHKSLDLLSNHSIVRGGYQICSPPPSTYTLIFEPLGGSTYIRLAQMVRYPFCIKCFSGIVMYKYPLGTPHPPPPLFCIVSISSIPHCCSRGQRGVLWLYICFSSDLGLPSVGRMGLYYLTSVPINDPQVYSLD